ncbi:alpha/beta hydrolase fold domain-containing protein [uncultured Psychroserpens sp.]|uniref:alpha/beta hydrolase family protein n=1 Tax=uncultured Psychroserpens sp. TaxID=255436 RepID=UPI00263930B7|nr:alpha/beta hydrolase fold domain-containing protein [uncultured Psychroserpens sp.]
MVLKNQILFRAEKKPIVWDAYFKNDNNPKPIVVFCHGYKGFKDWGSWDLVAQYFSEQDVFFVKFNFSHNGGTVDDPIDFPDLEAFAENNYTKELDDLDDILNFILSKNFKYKNNINPEHIILIGHSRGGGISIIKTSEDKGITKLITWASICDFGKRTVTSGELEQWRKEGVKYVLNGRTKQQMPHNFQFYEDFKANEERLHIKSAIERISVPVLIIHAKDDPSVAFSEAEALHSWNTNTELIPVENSNHVFGSSHPWRSNTLPETLQFTVEKSLDFIKADLK